MAPKQEIVKNKETALPVVDKTSEANSKTISPVVEKVATNEANYWNSFYNNKFSIAVPSQFCVLVATEAPCYRPFVEFGCGNGRDAKFMAYQGFRVFAGDLSNKAIQFLQKQGIPNAEFVVCDVSEPEHVESLIEKARAEAKEEDNFNLTLYNRFFMHALDKTQELTFLKEVANLTKTGDTFYTEFRCSLDAALDKEHGKGHYRRYIETEKFIELLKSLGFNVKYQITGQGMAKYKTEDPFVSRIVFERT